MSYYCGYIKADQKEEWEKLVVKNPAGGLHQSFAWAKFQQAIGWESYKIGLFEDGSNQLVGGALIYEFSFSDGTSFLYIPHGPILDYSDEDQLYRQWKVFEIALHSIVKVGEKEKTTHIRIEPRLKNCPEWFLAKFRKAPINLQPKHTQVLDLAKSTEIILAEMKQKGRYNINLAIKKGVEVKSKNLSSKEVDIFYNLYKQTFTRNKFEGKEKDFFDSYLKTCKEFSKFYQAEFKGKILATAIVVNFGNRVTYLYGASSNEMRELMAPYTLHWQIIQDAKEQGFQEYDFWGIHALANDKDHDWYGITRFKKQFGGEQLDLVGAYDYVFQEDLYKDFIKKHES